MYDFNILYSYLDKYDPSKLFLITIQQSQTFCKGPLTILTISLDNVNHYRFTASLRHSIPSRITSAMTKLKLRIIFTSDLTILPRREFSWCSATHYKQRYFSKKEVHHWRYCGSISWKYIKRRNKKCKIYETAFAK